MRKLLIIWVVFLMSFPGHAQMVDDFSLIDVVSGNEFSLAQHKTSPAIVIIFTSNTCPFSKLYEQRILNLAKQFGSNNHKFVLVNPHAGAMEGESVEDMIRRSQANMGGMSYLADADQRLAQSFGISKLPEVVVISSGPTGFAVVYQGAIDNNPQLPQSASRYYLMDALQHISEKKAVSPASTRSVGCNVKGTN
jgi:thiol-disulfide isomerase/thioredoxin